MVYFLCTAQECPHLSDPKNGKVFIIENGKIALFLCEDGFTIRGRYSLYCSGKKWSSLPPVCLRR